MDALTRDLVWDRAHHRCEYCLIHQDDEPFYRLHLEHVVAKQHSGSDDPATWRCPVTTTTSTRVPTSPASIPSPQKSSGSLIPGVSPGPDISVSTGRLSLVERNA